MSFANEGTNMDFMVCFTGYRNGQDSVHTEWLKAHNEQEAISITQQYNFTEGCRIGLFVFEHDTPVRTVAGWKKIKGGKLKPLRPEDISDMLQVATTSVQLEPSCGDSGQWKMA
jgi:hypothetical protein